MNDVQRRAREIRAMHAKYGQRTPMRRAIEQARQELSREPEPVLEWDTQCSHPIIARAKLHQAPYDVTVDIMWEEYPDDSWIGEFSDHPAEGAIDMELADGGRYCRPHHSYRYFIPATEYRNLDWRFMKKILDDEVCHAWVRVTVSKAGIPLGTANIGGYYYEYGKEDEVASDCIGDLIAEATEEAEATLGDLCPMA